MKNKRWKREAKRLKGECVRNELCDKCSCFDKCFNTYLMSGAMIPEKENIRTIEMMFKGAK